MINLLLVEDDENLGKSLQDYLVSQGYEVKWCNRIADAKELDASKYEIMIFDWMLPDGEGVDLLKFYRSQGVSAPIIMLTARTDLIDKVIGLESGANDYMTKPFEPRELVTRIRVQLRDRPTGSGGAGSSGEEIIEVGELALNLTQRTTSFKGEGVELTKMEFDFLRLLVESPNRAYSREEILNKVWGYENYPSTRTVDTHVLQLRQKLDDALIETVRGIGYRFKHES
jgi:DNA-binding response OmpR family regulator